MRLVATFVIIFFITSPLFAFAHPGGLDASGGHKNRATGEYHSHKSSKGEGSSYSDAVIQAKVVRVIDGDTFVAVFPDDKVEKVRLRHINTPERGEPGFHEATNRLKSRIGGKTINIKVGLHKRKGNYLRGHYGRVLADIIDDSASHF